MILRTRLINYKNQHHAKWEIVEQDYLLSWVLYGLSEVPELRDNVVFKGGTCLRKCFFGDYRFSQDIDLSVYKNHDLLKQNLLQYIQILCQKSQEKLQNRGENILINTYEYTEKIPHPQGQQAFVIEAKLPWQREFLTKIYIEVTFEEIILLSPVKKSIFHPYGEELIATVATYDINEIVSEKIRAILQFSKKLHERGWARSRVRDYYDLWRIFHSYQQTLNYQILPELTHKKCAHKQVAFTSVSDIYNDKLMKNAQEEWNQWLKDIVFGELPDRALVLAELKAFLEGVFRNDKNLL